MYLHSIYEFSIRLLQIVTIVIFAACENAKTDNEISTSAAIINGTQTHYDTWQSAVLVETRLVQCTGTLIHPEVVLTAAHCIWSYQFGNDDREEAKQIVISGGPFGELFLAKGKELVVHPAWKGAIANDAADLALIRLAEPIETIEPSILRDYPSPNVDDKAVVVGYGENPLDPISEPAHRQGYTLLLDISPFFFETGGEANTCSGDSGGPLFTKQEGRWVLTGVTSFGDEVCSPASGEYSVNLLSYCGWLNDTVQDLVGEDLGMKSCIGCKADSVEEWGNPCGPGYPCCPEGTQCRFPDDFSNGTYGYCAPGCCLLGQPDVGYCTNITSGEESCLFTAEFESAYCAISCQTDTDCIEGTVCRNRPFASDKICIADAAGPGPDCDESDSDTDTDSDTDIEKTPSPAGGCQLVPTASNKRLSLIRAFWG